uniref:HTH psq-type domain-containing protein n=1 Tax=Graphocephala atropunctata TaxID=36148 RepID=A0A1B6KH05_9HEMI
MTAPTSKRAMRQLSVREKIDAVQRVHEGESKASVARQIGVPESTLRGWCKNEMKLKTMDKSGGSQSPSPSPPLDKRPRLDAGPEGEMDDALWFWLRNQQQHDTHKAITNNNHHHSSWFWKWYKEFGVPDQQPLDPLPALPDPDEPLPLVVRRNKEIKEPPVSLSLPSPVLVDSNKETEAKENTLSEDEDEPPATAADALKHGERFLRWLECCSDPSITAMQLLQFRYLLNNVKSCAQRRAANKTRSTRSRRK